MSVAVALVLLFAMAMAAGCVEQSRETQTITTPPVTSYVTLTDKELTEQTIADTGTVIQKTDQIIGWYRGNESTRNDPSLTTIMVKREIAVGFIVKADDEIAIGNYQQALIEAQKAYKEANESYNIARMSINEDPHCDLHPEYRLIYFFLRIILASLFPALLATVSYSLFMTKINLSIKRFRPLATRLSSTRVFAGSWIIFFIVLLVLKIKQLYTPYLSLFGTTIAPIAFWAGLVILEMILAIIVLGIVIGMLIQTNLKSRRKGFGSEGDPRRPHVRDIAEYREILAVVLLLLVMVIVIKSSFGIPSPFVYCV